ncbi:pentapeptide repeat-containing protein [Neisseria sicca]|uniref:pentapeptide repeat-containing protein n=1 Tax=Neisseria sicca TaxID=490 RepID=UPI00288084E0|nr:pentapeptide repeat-containing protein [Neisseria sicca]
MVKWNIWKKITETISKSKTWLDGQSNAVKVLCAGAISVIIFVLAYLAAIRNSDSNSVGYWNFIILIVSAPVAFVIWHFRDENNRQQIENQRKDINLKEFQKLSEWVSGAHLPEIKTVSKTTQKSSSKDGAEIIEQTTELSEEYAKKPDTADFDTFSKRDGAVALQISAIYNLLPFFRGDYGESFRLPAFNLLKSAWQAMQQESLKKLEKKNLSDEALNRIFNELEQKANSPMGVALTQVLLSLNRENTELNLRNFREMLPNICLAGMNFLLSGVTETARDLSSLNLYGVDFRGAVLQEVMFQKSNLRYAKLDNAILRDTNLQDANLEGAKLRLARLDRANLQDADISFANLINCQFKWKQLEKSKKMNSMKINIYDFSQVIYPDWEKVNNPKWEELTDHERENALQQFRQETKALIFGADGKIIDPPFENQTSIEIYSSKID